MHPYRTTRWLAHVNGDKVYDFRHKDEVLEYFKGGRGIGSLFSYLSTLIFRRDDWNRVPFQPQWNGTIYAHAFKIWAMLKAGGKLTYLYAPLVYNRNGNDTFMMEGALRRFRYDLDSYVLMANETYADDPELRRAFLGVARKSIWELAVKMRILAHNAPAWSEINPRLIECGFSRWQINLWTGLAFAHVLTAIPFNILHRIRLRRGVEC
jgi:hypothetical protein